MRKKAPISNIDELKSFLKEFFKDKEVKIYLFGSRAKGTHNFYSDIDLAIVSENNLLEEIVILREILEESNLPYKVDLIEFKSVDSKIKEKIINEGIEWI